MDVTLAADGAHAVVRVSDTGCGIAPGFLPHVFERFRQADGAVTRRAGGLGVGLTIARQLVDMHGGSITASSAGEGQGASFTVLLPRLSDARASAPADAPAEATPARLDGVRILLVEDDVDTRNVMTLVLTDAGAAVVTAGSADEAMQALATHPFDAILCDIGLPGEDGFSFMRRARATVDACRGLPALALSAFARKRDKQRARDVGFDGHLAKPIDPVELLRTLTTLLPERPRAASEAGQADAPPPDVRTA